MGRREWFVAGSVLVAVLAGCSSVIRGVKRAVFWLLIIA